MHHKLLCMHTPIILRWHDPASLSWLSLDPFSFKLQCNLQNANISVKSSLRIRVYSTQRLSRANIHIKIGKLMHTLHTLSLSVSYIENVFSHLVMQFSHVAIPMILVTNGHSQTRCHIWNNVNASFSNPLRMTSLHDIHGDNILSSEFIVRNGTDSTKGDTKKMHTKKMGRQITHKNNWW